MTDDSSKILTVIVIVIIILIILGFLWSCNGNNSVCIAATPDPVGNVRSKSRMAGELTISWDCTPNATHYRVYLNPCGEECEAQSVQGRNKVKGGCDTGNCCPTKCKSCVSQFNYKKLIETCETKVCIETCEPCVCFMVVAYNKCGQAGPCKEVNYAYVQCVPACVEGCIVSNDCDGLVIRWDCPRCCEIVHVYCDGILVESVPCCEGNEICLPQAEDCCEVALQCESQCGLGELNVIDYCDRKKRRKKKNHHDDNCGCDECNRHHSHTAKKVASRRAKVSGARPSKKQIVKARAKRSAKSFGKIVSMDNGPRKVKLRR